MYNPKTSIWACFTWFFLFENFQQAEEGQHFYPGKRKHQFCTMHVKKCVPTSVTFRYSCFFLLYTLPTVLCVAFFCTTKNKTKGNSTNAAKWISLPTKKQLIQLSFAAFFNQALQSKHWTNEEQVRIFIHVYLVGQVISKCLELENKLLAPDKQCLQANTWTLLFSTRHAMQHLLFSCLGREVWEKKNWFLSLILEGGRKCFKWPIFLCQAVIGNEIYIDERDKRKFCEHCMKSYVN